MGSDPDTGRTTGTGGIQEGKYGQTEIKSAPVPEEPSPAERAKHEERAERAERA